MAQATSFVDHILGKNIPVRPVPGMHKPDGTPLAGGAAEARHVAPHTQVTPIAALQLGSSPAIKALKRPLAAKQGTTSTSLAPLHTFPAEHSNEVSLRMDALANFATSINANQPVASIVDRLRVYNGLSDEDPQVAEVEGRALPVSAYFLAHLYMKLGYGLTAPGSDSALANNATKFAYYKAIGAIPTRDYLIEDVIKQQPFAGVGALSSYSEDDGAAGRIALNVPALAEYYLARTLTVNQVGIRRAKAFMIAAAVDLNSGFTIRAGGRSYVTEEINDIEDEIMDEFGIASMSLTGATTAAPSGHAVRGQPQDPFTGAGVFLFGDVYDEPTNISIVVSGAAVLLGIAALEEQGLEAIRSA